MVEELKELKKEHPELEGFKLAGGLSVAKGVADKAGEQVPRIANYEVYNQRGQRLNIIHNLDLSSEPIEDPPVQPKDAKPKGLPEFS
jgi:hypothetical protein